MDKKMISIDDLFKQRLGDAEEQERPGAWLHMRELLDEKMPAGPLPGAGTNWRRMLGYATGLLLLASVSVGSYELLSADRAHGGVGNNIVASSTGNSANKVAMHTTPAAQKAPATQTDVAAKNNVSSHITAKAAHPAGNKTDAVAYAAKETTESYNAYSSSSKKVAEKVAITSNKLHSLHNITNKTSVAHTSEKQHPDNKNTDNNHSTTAYTLASNTHKKHAGHSSLNGVPATASVHKSVTGSTIKLAANNTTTSGSSSVAMRTKHTTVHKLMPAGSAGAVKANKIAVTGLKKNASSQSFELRRDTIQRLDIIQRYTVNSVSGTGMPSLDTIDVSKVAVQRMVMANSADNTRTAGAANNQLNNIPVAAANTGKQANSNIIPAAAMPNSSTDSKNNLGLAAHAASRGKGSAWSLARFNEFISDMKSNLGTVRFSPGITGGINGTFFGSQHFGGIELGITGNFAFSDHWDILTELKYFNRFSKGVLNDDYTAIKATGSGQERDSMRHYFNYSSMQSIELPVSVRYTLGNFALFAGGNLIYDFRVNAEEVQLPYQVALEGPVSAPKLSANDFGARFGAGYLLGLGYNITPSLQLDVRMTQTFWDNSKGSGAQLISNEFYRKPSFQLSVNYRLNAQHGPVVR